MNPSQIKKEYPEEGVVEISKEEQPQYVRLDDLSTRGIFVEQTDIQNKQMVAPVVVYSDTTVTTHANSLTETTLNSLRIRFNDFILGRTIKVSASGIYSTFDGSSLVTINYNLTEGDGTAVLSAGITNTAAQVTNAPWELTGYFTINKVGTSGTYVEHGTGGINSVFKQRTSGSTTADAIDTTQAITFSVSADWDTANAGNTISILRFMIELL